MIGSILDGRYKILAIVGRGSASTVYEAEHQLMHRTVAIKMLHTELLSDAKALERFKLEAQAVSQLSHPNIVRIHDFGVAPDGEPYLVMDRVEGPGLAQIIAERGPIPIAEAVEIFSQVASGLAHAHAKGILHRDIKPSNIILEHGSFAEGSVKVVDFGVAKLLGVEGEEAQRLTKTGEVFATPLYMSPEQCMGRPLDGRSDVYSLGCVMYETLSGKPAFAGTTPAELIVQHTTQAPQALDLSRVDSAAPAGLPAVVHKAMEKDPARRYQSMAELAAALSPWRQERAVSTSKGGWPIKATRHGKALAICALLTVLAVAGLCWLNLTDGGKLAYQKAKLIFQGMTMDSSNPELERTLQAVAGMEERQGEFLEAADAYQRCLPFVESRHKEKSMQRAEAYLKVGDCYFKGRDRAKARLWYEKALAILEPIARGDGKNLSESKDLWEIIADRRMRCFSPRDKGYGESLLRLGAAQIKLNQVAAGKANLERALSCFHLPECADRDNITLAQVYLAEHYAGIAKYDKAESLALRALDYRRAHSKPDSLELAQMCDVLVAIYMAEKKYDRAEPYAKESAAIWQQSWHKWNAEIDYSCLNSLARLGFIYWQNGKHELGRSINRKQSELKEELPDKEKSLVSHFNHGVWGTDNIPK